MIVANDQETKTIYEDCLLGDEAIATRDNPGNHDAARQCVENMVAHFREFGGVWEKSSGDIVDELEHFNAWEAHKNGVGWQEVTLAALQAAFKERIQKIEAEAHMTATTSYHEELFFGKLIDKAIVEEQSLEQVGRLQARIACRNESRNMQ